MLIQNLGSDSNFKTLFYIEVFYMFESISVVNDESIIC